eukprot:TRINITY_DN38153_c0_g1_i1.p1 TRINITY_DN38153_c0_g1~~TRINITY_DN38153_c0_g1_i1.p1  ORF type:complete len:2775 (+),score=618.33 TRINITY_DN38153_c0_g1_i1:953-8326(+)
MPPMSVSGYFCVTVQVPIPSLPMVYVNFGIKGQLGFAVKSSCWTWNLDLYIGVNAGISIWAGLRLGLGVSLTGSWSLAEVPLGASGLDLGSVVSADGCPAKTIKKLKDAADANKCSVGNPFRLIWSAFRREVHKLKRHIFDGFRTVRQVFGKVVAFFRWAFGLDKETDVKEAYLTTQTRRSKDYDQIFKGNENRNAGVVALRVTCQKLMVVVTDTTDSMRNSVRDAVSKKRLVDCRFVIGQPKAKRTTWKMQNLFHSETYVLGWDYNVSRELGGTRKMAITGQAVMDREIHDPVDTVHWTGGKAGSGVFLADASNNKLIVEARQFGGGPKSAAGGYTQLGSEMVAGSETREEKYNIGVGCRKAGPDDTGPIVGRRKHCPTEVVLTVKKVSYRGTLSVKCKEQRGSLVADQINDPAPHRCTFHLARSAMGAILGEEQDWASTQTQKYFKYDTPSGDAHDGSPVHFWGEGRSWSLWNDAGAFPPPGPDTRVLEVQVAKARLPTTSAQLSWKELLGEEGFNGRKPVHRLHQWSEKLRSGARKTVIVETLFEPAGVSSLQPVFTGDYDFTSQATSGRGDFELKLTDGKWHPITMHKPGASDVTLHTPGAADLLMRKDSSMEMRRAQAYPEVKASDTECAVGLADWIPCKIVQDNRKSGGFITLRSATSLDRFEITWSAREAESRIRKRSTVEVPQAETPAAAAAPSNEVQLPGIDNEMFLRATSGIFTAAGGFLSKLPKYAEQLIDRLIDDPTTDNPQGTGKLALKKKDCSVSNDAKTVDEGCELTTATGADSARVYRDPSEDVIYSKDGKATNSDFEEVKDDHVMNIAKSMRVSIHISEPIFWLQTTQSLGNLVLRAIGDVQMLFNVYFAEDPFWNGHCDTLQMVSDLPYESENGFEQGSNPRSTYKESREDKETGCGAECMAYQKGVKYAQLHQKTKREDPENEQEELSYNPILDTEFAYGVGYNNSDEEKTMNARLGFFTPDAPTRTPFGRYFFESTQDTAVFGQFWCQMAKDALNDKSSSSPRVRKALKEVPEAAAASDEEATQFPLELPSACMDPGECAQRTQCEKVNINKPFVAMFPSVLTAAKASLNKIDKEIKTSITTVDALDAAEDEDSPQRLEDFKNLKAATFRALAHAREFLMALGACNGEEGPLGKAWAAASQEEPGSASFLWSPVDRSRLCKQLTAAGLQEKVQSAPRYSETCRNTGQRCTHFCDPATPLMRMSHNQHFGTTVRGAQCVNKACRCHEGFCWDRRIRQCVASQQVRQLEADAEASTTVAALKPQLVDDFVQAFGVKTVLPLYMQRSATASKHMRVHGAFFEYFKRILRSKQAELASESEEARAKRMEKDLKVRITDFVSRMKHKRRDSDGRGIIELPLWKLTSSLSFAIETATIPGLCFGASALYTSMTAKSTHKSWDWSVSKTTFCFSGRVFPAWIVLKVDSCGTIPEDEVFVKAQIERDGYASRANPLGISDYLKYRVSPHRNPLSFMWIPYIRSYSNKDRDVQITITVWVQQGSLGGDGWTQANSLWTAGANPFEKFGAVGKGMFAVITEGASLSTAATNTVTISKIIGGGLMASPVLWWTKQIMMDPQKRTLLVDMLKGAWGGTIGLIWDAFKSMASYAKDLFTRTEDPAAEGMAEADDSLLCEDPERLRGEAEVPVDEEDAEANEPADAFQGQGNDFKRHEECNSLCGGKSFWTTDTLRATVRFSKLKLSSTMCAKCRPVSWTSNCPGKCQVRETTATAAYCCEALQCVESKWVRGEGVEVCQEPSEFVNTEDMLTATPCCHTACGAPGFEQDPAEAKPADVGTSTASPADYWPFMRFQSGSFLNDNDGNPTHCAECYWRKECPEGKAGWTAQHITMTGWKMCCRKHRCEDGGEESGLIGQQKDDDAAMTEAFHNSPARKRRGAIALKGMPTAVRPTGGAAEPPPLPRQLQKQLSISRFRIAKWEIAPECKITTSMGTGTVCGAKSFMGSKFQRERDTYLNHEDGTKSCAVCRWTHRSQSSTKPVRMQIGPEGGQKNFKVGMTSKLISAGWMGVHHLLCMKFECEQTRGWAADSLVDEDDEANSTEELDLEAYHSPNVPINTYWGATPKERRQAMETMWEKREFLPLIADQGAVHSLLQSDQAKQASEEGQVGFPLNLGLPVNFASFAVNMRWLITVKLNVEKRYRPDPDPDAEAEKEVLKVLFKWEVHLGNMYWYSIFESVSPVRARVGITFDFDLTGVANRLCNKELKSQHTNRVNKCLKCIEQGQAFCDQKYILPKYDRNVHEACLPKEREVGRKCTRPVKFDDHMETTSPRFLTTEDECKGMKFVPVNGRYKADYGPSNYFKGIQGVSDDLGEQLHQEAAVKRDQYENTIEEKRPDPAPTDPMDGAEQMTEAEKREHPDEDEDRPDESEVMDGEDGETAGPGSRPELKRQIVVKHREDIPSSRPRLTRQQGIQEFEDASPLRRTNAIRRT